VKNLSIITLLFLLSFTFACKKKTPTTTSTTSIGSDFFIEGKGLRKVWGMKSANGGLGQFSLSQITYSPDGFIHTMFTYGLAGINGSSANYNAYRKKINITTGDTITTAGIPASIPREWLGTLQSGCLEYGLIPYTDILARYNGSSIVGDPNWQSMPFASGFEKIYSTKQVACFSYSSVVNPVLWLGYNSVGNITPFSSKTLPLDAVCSSVELTLDGSAIGFNVLKSDSLQIYNYSTNTVIASIHLPLFTQYFPSNYPANYMPTARIITKRSQDGSKIIGTAYHTGNYFTQGGGRMLSTFVYDIATKTVALKVQNAYLNTGFYLTDTEDVDDDGNFYYKANDNTISIRKITPANGDQLYKVGFLQNNASIINVKCVMNKLIVACATIGNNTYSDDRGKGTLVIAVVE
jgi:hypothetical protein